MGSALMLKKLETQPLKISDSIILFLNQNDSSIYFLHFIISYELTITEPFSLTF